MDKVNKIPAEELFYIAPSDEIFEDARQAYIQIRKEISPEFYHEKVEEAQRLQNVGSNFMWFYQRLDWINQFRFLQKIKDETHAEINDRLSDTWRDAE